MLPEIAKLDPALVQCFYGADEEDTACTAPEFDRAERIETAGGHHFDGDYAALAEKIMAGAKRRLDRSRSGVVFGCGNAGEPFGPSERCGSATGRGRRAILFQRLGWLPHVVSLLLFALAIWVIHRELAAYRPADLLAHLAAIPTSALALALIAAALGYGALTLFDPLALRYLGKGLPYRQTGLASFIGYAFSHNLGLGWLSGGAVRYRLYSAWGLSSLDIGGILAFNTVTTFLGLGAILALACLGEPAEIAAILRLPRPVVVVIGLALVGAIAGYLWPRRSGGRRSGCALAAEPADTRRGGGSDRPVAARLDARRRGPLRPAAARPAVRFPAVRRPVRSGQSGRADQQRPGRHRRVRGGGPARDPG